MTDPTQQQLATAMRALETTGRIAARPLSEPGVDDLQAALAQMGAPAIAAMRHAVGVRANRSIKTIQEDIRS